MTPARKKRILFLTHALESRYGASTSLRLLLKNYRDIEADIVVPRSLSRPRDLARTAADYPCVREVHEFCLPMDLDLVGIRLRPREKLHVLLHRLLWTLRDRRRFRALLRRKNYDVVHVNSPVLHLALDPGTPTVTHIRDIVLDVGHAAIRKLAAGLGLVFIDDATRRPFAAILDRIVHTTLNNPFDMTGMAAYRGRFTLPGLTSATTVFSVIGRVSEIKGVHMVVAAFREGAPADSLLLVVGDGPADYVARCRSVAGDDPRIVFLGERDEVRDIYAATDYVVRGDPGACVGRTVYEGLYAGCGVILPGLGEPDFLFDLDRFQGKVILYKSGDPVSLAGAFATAPRLDKAGWDGMSNVAEYVRQFDAFLDRCLAGSPLENRL